MRFKVYWLPGRHDPFGIHIGRYDISSIDNAKKKIAQHPQGTVFFWDGQAGVTGLGASELAALRQEMQAFANSMGMTIEDQ